MFPVALEIVYLGIYPVDKLYMYLSMLVAALFVTKKKKKKEENMCGMLYQGDSE